MRHLLLALFLTLCGCGTSQDSASFSPAVAQAPPTSATVARSVNLGGAVAGRSNETLNLLVEVKDGGNVEGTALLTQAAGLRAYDVEGELVDDEDNVVLSLFPVDPQLSESLLVSGKLALGGQLVAYETGQETPYGEVTLSDQPQASKGEVAVQASQDFLIRFSVEDSNESVVYRLTDNFTGSGRVQQISHEGTLSFPAGAGWSIARAQFRPDVAEITLTGIRSLQGRQLPQTLGRLYFSTRDVLPSTASFALLSNSYLEVQPKGGKGKQYFEAFAAKGSTIELIP